VRKLRDPDQAAARRRWSLAREPAPPIREPTRWRTNKLQGDGQAHRQGKEKGYSDLDEVGQTNALTSTSSRWISSRHHDARRVHGHRGGGRRPKEVPVPSKGGAGDARGRPPDPEAQTDEPSPRSRGASDLKRDRWAAPKDTVAASTFREMGRDPSSRARARSRWPSARRVQG